MKQITLSIEQMKHLEELGLNTSDASMYYVYDDMYGVSYLMINEEVGTGDVILNDCYIYAYTLQDILEKLPEFAHLGPFNGEYRCVCHITHSVASKCGNTMLEAAYQMLLWCIENNYIKINKV